MSDLTTHLAAIGVGVAIALLFVGGFKNKQEATEPAAAVSAAKTNGAAASSSSKKKNKKKNKKKAAAAKPQAAPAAAAKPAPKPTPAPKPAPAPAPVAAPAPPAKETPVATAPNGGKKKKNKKKKNGAAAATNGAAAPKPAPAPEPAPAPAPPAPAPEPVVPAITPLQPREIVEEEWETIPKKNRKKKNSAQKKQQEAAADDASAAATKISLTVTIDAARVGIIIGPKGATMNAIQEKTGTKLDVNAPKPEEKAMTNQFRPVVGGRSKSSAKATVVITEGTAEGQKTARKAILELADRGYAALLQAEGFGESSVSVHPRFLSEIVGTGGKIIKAIQSELDVKLTIPKTEWTPKTLQIGNIEPSVRIGIAGDSPANVKQAKQVIKDITVYHHHEVTHPDLIHQEVFVPQEFFHCVIGTRGSEIKHIRGNYNVEVYMPSNESWCVTENVICVGKSNDVEKAISYIKLLMDRDSELREQKYSDEGYADDSFGW